MKSQAIKTCDIFPDEPAVALYQWPWDGPGSSGACSLKGQQILRQQAANLKRQVSFLPLANAAAPTLTRDERTRLIAERLSAESERDETSQRAVRLYEQNTAISAELKALKVREAEAVAQLKDAREDLHQAGLNVSKLQSELGRVSDLLARANALLEAGPGEAEAQAEALKRELERAQLDFESRWNAREREHEAELLKQ